jgi:hypothetical protein
MLWKEGAKRIPILFRDGIERACPTHRVAYTLYYGGLPDSWLIYHLCGNNKTPDFCVNPLHLEAYPNRSAMLKNHVANQIEMLRHREEEEKWWSSYVNNGIATYELLRNLKGGTAGIKIPAVKIPIVNSSITSSTEDSDIPF